MRALVISSHDDDFHDKMQLQKAFHSHTVTTAQHFFALWSTDSGNQFHPNNSIDTCTLYIYSNIIGHYGQNLQFSRWTLRRKITTRFRSIRFVRRLTFHIWHLTMNWQFTCESGSARAGRIFPLSLHAFRCLSSSQQLESIISALYRVLAKFSVHKLHCHGARKTMTLSSQFHDNPHSRFSRETQNKHLKSWGWGANTQNTFSTELPGFLDEIFPHAEHHVIEGTANGWNFATFHSKHIPLVT